MPDSEPFVTDTSGYITYREAMRTFTTKSDSAGLQSAIHSLTDRVSALVPRSEHQLRWQVDDARYDALSKELRRDIESLSSKVEQLMANRLPRWFLPLTAIIVPCITAAVMLLISHYWH